ncbi:hypothetical protein ABL78_1223 [Leptomonas seymouri]|uniref:PIN domain-containing protein n=1 Tax=Leptomonas seymouri TaxID=5684 RepID=A0A0N1IME6_LEPSE|nr:hypothetical protein ABL78_1223 [Leptomonas seymouri]|eukprot:KPI89642.1 hypothetical protein ABL78_1223 [Leptomonas seymouri]
MTRQNRKQASPPSKNRGTVHSATCANSSIHHHSHLHDQSNNTASDPVRSTSRPSRAAPAGHQPVCIPKPRSAHQHPLARAAAHSISDNNANRTTSASTVSGPTQISGVRNDGETRGTSQGFKYLSPEVLAASQFSPVTQAPDASPHLPHSSAAQPQQPSRSPSIQPTSAAESSLARLRALASGASSLVLSPASLPPLELYKNEESPLLSSLPSSAPSTPYTPDLVRRLAELNGTSYKQTASSLRLDRLKGSRAAGTSAAAMLGSLSSDQLSSLGRNEEDEEELRRISERRSSHRNAALLTRVSAARGRRTSFENEEEVRDSGHRYFLPCPAEPQLTATSRLDRLRAAGRAGSVASPSSLPTTPASNSLLAPLPHCPHLIDSPTVFFATLAAASPAPAASLSSPSPTSVDVTSRLAQLRQRASAAPVSSALGPLSGSSFSTSAPPAASLAPTVAATGAPQESFMNLELMQVGHGSASPSAHHCASADGYPGRDRRGAGSLQSVRSSLPGVHDCLGQAPRYDLLARGETNQDVVGGNTGATPSTSFVPSSTIDTELQEADELRSLEAQLQRYRDVAAQSLLPCIHTHASDGAMTTPEVAKSVSSLSSSPRPKRVARRSRRRQSASAAKKGSAVVTLVKGRKSRQRLGVERGDLTGGRAALSSAQVVARLRRLAAPVAVEEPVKAEVSESGAALPLPTWSSTSPFAAIASPSLLGMLSDAARDHQNDGASVNGPNKGDGEVITAGSSADSQPAAPSSAGLSFYSSASTSPASRPTAAPDLRRLPASSQCIVFDTCSLLDSEPGVLNVLLERAHIGIPFKVLDELDFMHKGGVSGQDSSSGGGSANGSHDREWRRKRAHDLRNWIASCVSRSSSHLLLQKRTEVIEAYDRQTATNDDQILGYAVYLRRHREKVIFVTEDKFLRIKAAAEIGKAYSYSEVRQMVGMPAALPSSSTAVRRIAVRRTRQKKEQPLL